jgi:hypothetical protein
VNFEVMVFGKNGHLVMLVKFFHLCWCSPKRFKMILLVPRKCNQSW